MLIKGKQQHTCAKNECSDAEEQDIDRLHSSLDVSADFIHVTNEADICLDKDVLSFRIQRLAFGCDAVSGFLGASNEISSWLAGMLRKALERRFTNSVSTTDEDRNETRREYSEDASIGRFDVCEGNHFADQLKAYPWWTESKIIHFRITTQDRT